VGGVELSALFVFRPRQHCVCVPALLNSYQSVEKRAQAAQGCAAEFRRLSKSRENREVGRSAFGQSAVEKAREGFFNGL
jgi:hypothetical protein